MSTMRNRSKAEMLDWLQTHVRIDDDCRIWAGSRDSFGYPIICWMPRGKRLSGRVILLELLRRQMPAKPVIWSTCGRTDCMTPAHLHAGTRADLTRWMAENRRTQSGPAHSVAIAVGRAPNSRMGMSHARTIMQAVAAGATHRQIAAEYRVSPSAVGHAMRRWRAAGVI